MSEELIFDIGFHLGEDSDYFLKKGFKVVAIDANPQCVAAVGTKFGPYINSGQLTLINCAISNFEGYANFNISQESVWSSLNFDIANRQEALKDTVTVKARTLLSLIEEFGMPSYCKIDIEGSDKHALQSLFSIAERPELISVETECIGQEKQLGNGEALETLLLLRKLGYTKFKLVDQTTLLPLLPDEQFYTLDFLGRIRMRARYNYIFLRSYRHKLSKIFGHHFLPGCSGPFGDDISGPWLDFNTARATLLYHREAYYSKKNALNYGFWCDWHAKWS
ncbi:FkbM family methyltransferase [Pedobacter sp. SYSU D00535]|uniref:FkbM family methyltransferase n=1 Tax=Pedobacter sp. SYSU D00535 TaxID=2810308 RepID=UPI001A979B48